MKRLINFLIVLTGIFNFVLFVDAATLSKEQEENVVKMVQLVRSAKNKKEKSLLNLDIGKQYYSAGVYDKATEYFEKSIALFSSDKAYYYKIKSLQKQKKYQEALECSVLAKKQDNVSRYYMFEFELLESTSLWYLHRFSDVEMSLKMFKSKYSKVLQNNVFSGYNHFVNYDLGTALQFQGKYNEALIYFDMMKKDDSLTFFSKAYLFWEMGKYDLCKEEIKKLEKSEGSAVSDSNFVNLCWAMYYYGVKEYDKALNYVEKEFKSTKDVNAEYYEFKALILLAKNDAKQALKYANEDVKKSTFVRSHLTRAKIYYALGEKENALKEYRYVYNNIANYLQKNEAAKMIRILSGEKLPNAEPITVKITPIFNEKL